eukprot:TRINITY_DN124957_c0_g1_i1.p1 TRINITY_DN124957_c0_g1~~TRINITY_DN124957_c0_g1_i1.p1  ORF type:complete len:296 (-),score=61.37 TRINITY_DN124957_c0_g1_i1:120-1007(-)
MACFTQRLTRLYCCLLAGYSLLVCDAVLRDREESHKRVVFSLTTMPNRIAHIKPILDALVEQQTHPPDAVLLAVPPQVKKLPKWLERYNETSARPGVLKVLHMARDYGPASKLLAAVAEGQERSPDTLIVYGDDDIMYSPSIIEQHVKAQGAASKPTAFGSRKIGIGDGAKRESLLEATGTISLPASVVPDAVFRVPDMPKACYLSDDYWISHHLADAGVQLELLDQCQYDFNSGVWPDSCGTPFHPVDHIEKIGALSSTVISSSGKVKRSGGDWRSQLQRYEDCQGIIDSQRGA